MYQGQIAFKQLDFLGKQQMMDSETTKIVHKLLYSQVLNYLQGLLTRVSLRNAMEN